MKILIGAILLVLSFTLTGCVETTANSLKIGDFVVPVDGNSVVGCIQSINDDGLEVVTVDEKLNFQTTTVSPRDLEKAVFENHCPFDPANTDALKLIANKLREISKNPDHFIDLKHPKITMEGRLLGVLIYLTYGYDSMVYVCEQCKTFGVRAYYRSIEYLWDGIGEWRG